MPSNDQLTCDVDTRDIGVKFIKFEGKFNKINEFTLIQTFNQTSLSNKELEKSAFKITE